VTDEMRADVARHRRQRFCTESGHLIHDGPRQTAKQRRRRLRAFLRQYERAHPDRDWLPPLSIPNY
jgi:hypothetical protein